MHFKIDKNIQKLKSLSMNLMNKLEVLLISFWLKSILSPMKNQIN